MLTRLPPGPRLLVEEHLHPPQPLSGAGVDTSPPPGFETDQVAYRPHSREEVLEPTPRGVPAGPVRSDRWHGQLIQF